MRGLIVEGDSAVGRRHGNRCVTHAGIVHEGAEGFVVGLSHLHHDAGVLGKQSMAQTVGRDSVQVHFQAALRVGEAHFEQAGYESARADIVTAAHESFFNQGLRGVERVDKVVGLGYIGRLLSDGALGLCKGRASQGQRRVGEVDMVEGRGHGGVDYWPYHAAHVAYESAGAHYDGARSDNLAAVGILLRERQTVLARGHVNMQVAAEKAQCLDGIIESGVFTLLRAARPHPVGRKRDAVEFFLKGCEHDIGECLGHSEPRAGTRIGQRGLRGMSDGCSHAVASAIVECHHATVGQRQLQFAHALLLGHPAGHTAVHLVRKPVFAGNGFQLEHAAEVCLGLTVVHTRVFILAFDGRIAHDGARRVAEHLVGAEVERLYAVFLHEAEATVAGSLADHVERGPLAAGYLLDGVDMLFVNQQAHALLALVGNDFLGRERGVADRQAVHVDTAATRLHQFRQAVQVACRAVVVDRDDGVIVGLAEGTHQVGGTLLHFGVGTLHGVQFHGGTVAARIYRRHAAAAQADAIVVAAHDDHLVAGPRLALERIALGAAAHAAGQHDNLIVGVGTAALLVLERKHAAGDERLSELVAEV